MTRCDTESGDPGLTLVVANELEAIEGARQAMLGFIAPLGLSARLVYMLELVLEESLMNRARHAFPDGRRTCTEVTLIARPDALTMRFEDDGVAFDPLQLEPSRPAASLDDVEVGGLGIPLTRKAAFACHYERVGGRNRFTVCLARD